MLQTLRFFPILCKNCCVRFLKFSRDYLGKAQIKALQLYNAEVLPNLVSLHKDATTPTSGSRQRQAIARARLAGTQTVNAVAAEQWGLKMAELFGSRGEKLASMDYRCALLLRGSTMFSGC